MQNNRRNFLEESEQHTFQENFGIWNPHIFGDDKSPMITHQKKAEEEEFPRRIGGTYFSNKASMGTPYLDTQVHTSTSSKSILDVPDFFQTIRTNSLFKIRKVQNTIGRLKFVGVHLAGVIFAFQNWIWCLGYPSLLG